MKTSTVSSECRNDNIVQLQVDGLQNVGTLQNVGQTSFLIISLDILP